MAGQTNCWILPEGEYGAYRGMNGDIYVMTARSARNLSFQDRLPHPGKPELLLALTGQDLIGVPLKVSCICSAILEGNAGALLHFFGMRVQVPR